MNEATVVDGRYWLVEPSDETYLGGPYDDMSEAHSAAYDVGGQDGARLVFTPHPPKGAPAA